MRIAAIDIGSNSTRLLVADVDGTTITEHFRRSVVTRLGDGVDTSGQLSEAAIERVMSVIGDYKTQFTEVGAERVRGVATSAVRDAGNGQAFATAVLEQHGVQIDVIGGDREAEFTFAGASNGGALSGDGRTVVVDIGGGSTEFIIGDDGTLSFHVSTNIGAVRQSERHLHSDPPAAGELVALLKEADEIIRANVPPEFLAGVSRGIGVAGTPTVLAAVDQALVEFDPWKVHGYAITREAAARLLARLAGLPLAERREVVGLHPDRAPTIVAGAAIMLATMQAFELQSVEVSEHDILYGLALDIAS
jgi:exopolyphosphatase/guanosine-5'-triphosphate,3'-diphosphate pyrophosphatase